jgi:hypothetical protein
MFGLGALMGGMGRSVGGGMGIGGGGGMGGDMDMKRQALMQALGGSGLFHQQPAQQPIAAQPQQPMPQMPVAQTVGGIFGRTGGTAQPVMPQGGAAGKVGASAGIFRSLF